MLSANQQPDHWTISEFRRRHLQALGDLFIQTVKLADKAGLVKLKHVAIDGTKIKANASKHSAMSYEYMKQEKLKQEQAKREEAAKKNGKSYRPRKKEVKSKMKAQRNFTDSDSRIMYSAEKAYIQGYNAQASKVFSLKFF